MEDLAEALFQSGTAIKFGLAFCEASGDRKIRWGGRPERRPRRRLPRRSAPRNSMRGCGQAAPGARAIPRARMRLGGGFFPRPAHLMWALLPWRRAGRRYDGNDEGLVALAQKNALQIGAGHSFIILMRNAFTSEQRAPRWQP